MGFLLKYQAYPPAVIVALLLHSILLYFVIASSGFSAEFVDVDDEVYVNATLSDVNPQKLRRLEVVQQQRQADQRAQQRRNEAADLAKAQEAERIRENEREIERELERETQRADQQRIERENSERISREAADKVRQEELARIQEQERINQIAADLAAAETARVAEAQRQTDQAATDESNVQAYTVIIRNTVANNWSIPPSARNGMIVVISLRLVPTGEVVASTIFQESGDAAFDRSALQAVARAERFPELQEMPSRLFEQHFRTVNLRFRPEDLLR